MSFRFHPEAATELSEAVQYYEDVDQGLGQDFAGEALSAIQRAVTHPRAWTVLDDEVRRSLIRRFPYGILYAEENQGILIVAVMYLRRAPDYWKERL